MSLLLTRGRRYGGGREIDLLLSGGRIAAVGVTGTLDADLTASAEIVDLDGRFIGPGLWDEHIHMNQNVAARQRLDLSTTASAAEVLDLVREAAAQRTSPGERQDLLVGYGFRDGVWPDAPGRSALDVAADGVPVVLVSGDLHCGWIGSVAADRLGLPLDETGLLREGPWIAALAAIDDQTRVSTAALLDTSRAAARLGVVGVLDFENTDTIGIWPERTAAGATLLRVETSVWPEYLDKAIARGLRTGDVLDEAGLVTMGPLKVVVDGSLNTRTAWCHDAYPGTQDRGINNFAPEHLRDLMRQAQAGGISAAVHAIGDRANSEVLDAFAELGMTGRIEHAQLVAEADFPRFAALGVEASVQPEHAMDDRDVADRHWSGRTGQAFAYAGLLKAGARLRMGSDAPVAPLDPWATIAAAVTRSRDGREPWHPEQRLSVSAALAASSRTTLSLGEPADVVVLDRDPLTTPESALRGMPVAATLVAGQFTWSGL